MITSSDLAARLGITEDAATAALAQVDQTAIRAEELGAWAYEVWDRLSPVNDTPAAVLLATPAAELADAIYLIRDTRSGMVRTFQPHAPGLPGHVAMTAAEVPAYAEPERQRIALEIADSRTIAAVLGFLEAE